MSRDIEQAVREYDDAVTREPMRAQPGQVRRTLSTDEKRVKHQINRSGGPMSQPRTAAIADLLSQAGRAQTLEEQQALMAQVEGLRTAQLAEHEAASAYHPEQAKILDTLVPGRVHERTSAATDWLLDISTEASLEDGAQEMLAQASLWYGRVPREVKEYGSEYAEQARNKAHRLASQYGEVAEQVERVFLDETARLHALGVRAEEFSLVAEGVSLDNGGEPTSDLAFEAVIQAEANQYIKQQGGKWVVTQKGTGKVLSHHDSEEDAEASFRGMMYNKHKGSLQAEAGAVDDIVGPMKTGQDTEGLQEKSDEVAQQYTSAQTMPQVDANGGNAVYPNEPDTSSMRAPALQELAQGDQGFQGHSVVPGDDEHAEADNGDGGTRDRARPAAGFPVGASQHTKEASVAQFAQCPSCGGHGRVAVRQLDPREAYSGLPQIDEIVGNDDHPGTAPAPGQSEAYPSDVAFPWAMDPARVQNTIQEAEQQIANRPQGRPGAPGAGGGPGGSVATGSLAPGQQLAQAPFRYAQAGTDGVVHPRMANGRDNSGWIGDEGAKGLDYPGYSTPAYDGSTNLGQPDPVYGEGGDNPNQPHTPYGAQEAADFTNNPGQGWQYGQPTQDDQGYREVTPGMNTQGRLHPDPAIAAAQRQILAAQATIAQRNVQLQQAGY